MSQQVDISGLSKAAVLATLFNAAAPVRYGFLQAVHGPDVMTEKDAQEYITCGSPDPGSDHQGSYFDYLLGRPLKVDLAGDTFDPWGFDRDSGEGAAQRAISRLRETGSIFVDSDDNSVERRTISNAFEALDYGNEPTQEIGPAFFLGGSESRDEITEAVRRVVFRRYQE